MTHKNLIYGNCTKELEQFSDIHLHAYVRLRSLAVIVLWSLCWQDYYAELAKVTGISIDPSDLDGSFPGVRGIEYSFDGIEFKDKPVVVRTCISLQFLTLDRKFHIFTGQVVTSLTMQLTNQKLVWRRRQFSWF